MLIVHRDIKPENLMYDQREEVVKLIDFGLSYQLESKFEKLYLPCGSPGYVAPEVIANSQPGYGTKADVFAVGAILFKLLTGLDLFFGETAEELFENNRQMRFTPTIKEWDGISERA